MLTELLKLPTRKKVFAAANEQDRDESSCLITDPESRDAQLSGWCRSESGELFRGFPILKTDRVLDVGCGHGSYSVFCAAQGASVVFADIDAHRIAEANQRFIAENLDRRMGIVTDVASLPLQSSSFDKIVAMEVLEHVNDPAAVMRELIRVAKAGELFLLSVPAEQSERVQSALAPAVYFERPNHIRIFTSAEFEALVHDVGLTIEHRYLYGFYHSIWWALFWTCNQDLSDPPHPLLRSWTQLWGKILASRDGNRIKEALDQALPKSQVIIARKP